MIGDVRQGLEEHRQCYRKPQSGGRPAKGSLRHYSWNDCEYLVEDVTDVYCKTLSDCSRLEGGRCSRSLFLNDRGCR
jgi:hypothetical protein